MHSLYGEIAPVNKQNEHLTDRKKEMLGLSPLNIAFHMADLSEFSNTVSPPSDIPDYIKEKTNEKIKLEQEIGKLKAQIENKRRRRVLRGTALEDGRITSFRLKWYTDLSEQLRKYGIPVHDISKLAKLVDNISQYDYDVEKVINEFSDPCMIDMQDQLQITQQLLLLFSSPS
jgi:hypothetical protein